MTGRYWLVAGLAAFLVAAPGCMVCGHRGHHLALRAGPECELPACQRNGVYVFAVSSLNPVSVLALDGLREELNRQGFPKVATGQAIHFTWMAREMRRIRDAEPEAVFVVVGFESAAPVAVELADRVAGAGLSVGGVVVIGTGGTAPPSRTGLQVLAVGNVAEAAGGAEAVNNVAAYGLAADARTVEAVVRVLQAAASGVPFPVVTEQTEWSYPHAPPMRRAGDPARHPEWSFLFDEYAPVTVAPPTPPASPAVPTLPVVQGGGVLRSAIR
jgi:hypothetical protein